MRADAARRVRGGGARGMRSGGQRRRRTLAVLVLAAACAAVATPGGALARGDAPSPPAASSPGLAAPNVAPRGDALEVYAGTYDVAGAPGLRFRVARRGDALTAQLTGQPAAELAYVGGDTFRYVAVAATLRFGRDAAGAVVALRLDQGGGELEATRLGFIGAASASPSPPAAVTPPAQSPPAAAPSPSSTPAVAPGALAAYVGTYLVGPQLAIAVVLDGARLTAQLTGQPAFTLHRVDGDAFDFGLVDAHVDFQRDGSGAVVGLRLRQNGTSVQADRQR